MKFTMKLCAMSVIVLAFNLINEYINNNVMKKSFIFLALLLLPWMGRAESSGFRDSSLPIEERVSALLEAMTIEEKINCFSTRPSLPRLGIRTTRITEGLHGYAHSGPANWAVKGAGEAPTTIFPQAIGLAQTWDTELIRQVAATQAYEHRYLFQSPKYSYSGGIITLAPNADLGRDPRWGRTEECFGEDPFLVSRMVVAYVKGLQGNHPKYWMTASLMKHFLANSNENNRFSNSSDFDERLFREYYAYTFYKGITEGGSRAFMAAYNAYNGIPCTVHPVLKEVTVDEWGQDGIICTDGGGLALLVNQHHYFLDIKTAVAACIKSGINMILDDIHAPYIRQALSEGLLTEADIDASLRGLIRVWIRLGLLDNQDENPYSAIGVKDTLDPWLKPDVHEFVRKVTAKSVVLLKNEKNLLPLKPAGLKKVAVIGPSANEVVSDWYTGTPPYAVTVLQGVKNALGSGVEVTFAESNKADSAYILAKEADVAIVCVGNHPCNFGIGWGYNFVASDGREEVDRQALSLEQEDLVKLVKSANPNTVLVLVSSFPYAINWSKEHVPAILHITQSSQELGNGLADVIFGKENPAGRLVQAWPKSIDDLKPIREYDIRKGKTYLYMDSEPLFPFGYGLSYTKFNYRNISADKSSVALGDTVRVSLDVTNTGASDGEEVVQIYASYPGSKVEHPAKALKGFARVAVKRGETVRVEIPVPAEVLAYWDEEAHAFVLEKGKVRLSVGSSSADLRGNVTVSTR